MLTDIHQDLKTRAARPVLRTVSPEQRGSASHKLRDGRRVTCSVRANELRPKAVFYEWYIDGIAIDATIAKVALAND